ncbi:MAG: hypothetical protein JWO38_8009 [Gemmataceae bacterium]|nr:hypothetical protein [Gemmataceae bacterium]
MPHGHHHHGESLRDYFTEQLLTIFVVGMFGAVAILLYRSGNLQYVLAKPFHLPVLIGGITVMVLVVVRAISVWREAGEANADQHDHNHHHDHNHAHAGTSHDHDHDHVHGPDCDHDHGHDHDHHHTHDHHHDHGADDHGHSHDLAWVFARMLVLFFPVALYLIGVPNSGFSQDRINKILGSDQSIDAAALAEVASKEGTVMSFNDLNDAAYDDSKRDFMQGQTAKLEGKYRRVGPREFTLYKLRMTCCAADTIPLKVRIFLEKGTLSSVNENDWVRVKGKIQFAQVPNSNPAQYIPVIMVAEAGDIAKTEAKSEYE